MTTYSYRPYAPGDEFEINLLYKQITGCRRSSEAYFWQWFGAPGGKGEIWLIEANEADGRKKLIGHHGVMPICFSRGQEDLLFGKTENTFVHPDYRKKILYPRFEKQFRNHYENRFHALFSTTGPNAAIRQRLAQGYKFNSKWVSYLWLVGCKSAIRFSITYFVRKLCHCPNAFCVMPIKPLCGQESIMPNQIKVTAYDRSDVQRLDIFRSFWKDIRKKYPLTPTRNYDDLKWRFWDNPYIPYTTLVLDSEKTGIGIAILYCRGGGLFVLEDFFVEQPQTPAFARLLTAVLQWASLCGAGFVQFTSTDDSIKWVRGSNFHPSIRYGNIQYLYDRARKMNTRYMPRKICQMGNKVGLKDDEWYVTGILSQGVTLDDFTS